MRIRPRTNRNNISFRLRPCTSNFAEEMHVINQDKALRSTYIPAVSNPHWMLPTRCISIFTVPRFNMWNVFGGKMLLYSGIEQFQKSLSWQISNLHFVGSVMLFITLKHLTRLLSIACNCIEVKIIKVLCYSIYKFCESYVNLTI